MDVDISALFEDLPVGVTVFDTQGRIAFYNDFAAQFVDRRPELIGQDIRLCHQPASVAKIEAMLDDLRQGRKERIYYENERNGLRAAVSVAPLRKNGEIVGFVQTFIVKA